MIQYYIDCDGVTFHYVEPFLDFINDLMGKKLYSAKQITQYNIPSCLGMPDREFFAYLNKYVEKQKFASQPFMDGAIEGIFHIISNTRKTGSVNYITVRPIGAYLQTIKSIRGFFKTLIKRFYNEDLVLPEDFYRLLLGNYNGTPKWKIIKVLNEGSSASVLIDDNPEFIHEVMEHCPETLTIWFNHKGFLKNTCHAHVKVQSWDEVIDILGDDIKPETINKLKTASGFGEQLSIL